MGKKITVSIGISAYNEEKNITKLLHSLFGQEAKSYAIREIIIYSDGSTDRTAGMVKKFHRKTVKLIEGKCRLGQASRMNGILRSFIGDVLVFLDADIILASSGTLENLMCVFVKNKNIGLAGGCTNPLSTNTFTSQAIAATSRAYNEIRNTLHGGNNIFGCSGHILGLSRSFAKQVRMREDIYATDAFLYFTCLRMGYGFKHVRSAKVWHRSPDNLNDQIEQNSRFVSSPHQLAEIFGDIVYKEYTIPRLFFMKVTLKQFIRMPLHSCYIFIVNVYCKLIAKKTAKKLHGTWNIVLSTKEGF